MVSEYQDASLIRDIAFPMDGDSLENGIKGYLREITRAASSEQCADSQLDPNENSERTLNLWTNVDNIFNYIIRRVV